MSESDFREYALKEGVSQAEYEAAVSSVENPRVQMLNSNDLIMVGIQNGRKTRIEVVFGELQFFKEYVRE